MPDLGDPTADGTVNPGKPSNPSKPASPGTKSGGTTGSGTNYDDGKMSKDEQAALKASIRLSWAALFPLGVKPPKIPANVLNNAVKARMSSTDDLLRYVRLHNRKVFQKTTAAQTRATEANQQLDLIFGENKTFKAAYMEQYVMADPAVYPWDKYLEKVVVKSKAFLNQYGGSATWNAFYKAVKGSGEAMDYASAIKTWQDRKTKFLDVYKETLGNSVDINSLPADIFNQAMKNNWNETQFISYVKQNDSAYLGTAPASTLGDQFDRFWHTVFGDTSTPSAELRTKWMQTGSPDKFGDFFTKYIRDSDMFKAAAPGYEQYLKNTGGTDGTGMPEDPMNYFTARARFRQKYKDLAENVDVSVPSDVIDRALAEGWSDAMLENWFKKNDPNYSGTATAQNKGEAFDQYWQRMFGTESKPDAAIRDKYVKGNLDNVESTFDDVRKTGEFQRQYTGWEDFASAQAAAGQSSTIINNPARYKEYENTFYNAFRNVGIEPPADFKSMFFKSGIDDQEIQSNLNTWVQTNAAYKWQTGDKANVAEVAGIAGDKAQDGDLRIRMEKALQQHKEFTGSKFGGFETSKDSGNLAKTI